MSTLSAVALVINGESSPSAAPVSSPLVISDVPQIVVTSPEPVGESGQPLRSPQAVTIPIAAQVDADVLHVWITMTATTRHVEAFMRWLKNCGDEFDTHEIPHWMTAEGAGYDLCAVPWLIQFVASTDRPFADEDCERVLRHRPRARVEANPSLDMDPRETLGEVLDEVMTCADVLDEFCDKYEPFRVPGKIIADEFENDCGWAACYVPDFRGLERMLRLSTACLTSCISTLELDEACDRNTIRLEAQNVGVAAERQAAS